ncbi:MAG: M15 family metallopeptidase [Actinomycetota bacterium]
MAPPRDHRQARFRQAMALVILVAVLFGLARLLSAVGGGEPRGVGSPTAGPPASPAEPLPPCAHRDRAALNAAYELWDRTLVDTRFRLSPEYEPPDLVSAGLAGFAGPYQVRQLVVADLSALREAAADAGNPIELEAAHRTYEQQAALFDMRVAELGEEEALRKVARPGHSEHQLGTTVDFKTAGAEDVDLTWGSTPAGGWTLAHAHEFGFILTYPEGAEARSCYAYEPWHYRYVGRQRAAAVMRSGLTLREFLWRESRSG